MINGIPKEKNELRETISRQVEQFLRVGSIETLNTRISHDAAQQPQSQGYSKKQSIGLRASNLETGEVRTFRSATEASEKLCMSTAKPLEVARKNKKRPAGSIKISHRGWVFDLI